jgi:hypothetical protein
VSTAHRPFALRDSSDEPNEVEMRRMAGAFRW